MVQGTFAKNFFVWTCVFIYPESIPRSGIAESYKNFFLNLIFKETAKLLSKVAAPFFIPPAVYEGHSFFTSLPKLVTDSLFYYSDTNVWFYFAFP